MTDEDLVAAVLGVLPEDLRAAVLLTGGTAAGVRARLRLERAPDEIAVVVELGNGAVVGRKLRVINSQVTSVV